MSHTPRDDPAPDPGKAGSADSATNHPFASQQPDTVSSLLSAANLTPAALHPMAGLGKGIDYLNLDDAVGGSTTADGRRRRGWADELAYGTGTLYFSGLCAGGAWGLYESLKSVDTKSSLKLRINSILNHCTRRGPFLSNSFGSIAMMFCGTRSMIRAVREADDPLNNILAAGAAGTIFKSTAGLRPAAQWGALGAAGAATLVVILELRKRLLNFAITGDRATV